LFGRSSPDLLALGSRGMTLTFLLLPVLGFLMPAGNYFMAVGKAGRSVLLMMARQVLVIPAVYLLPGLLGLDGVFAAVPAADAVAFVLAAVLFAGEWRALRARERAEAAEPAPAPGAPAPADLIP
jgi:Na+-driven multidrug efflux pump